jgi:hypothetical protein
MTDQKSNLQVSFPAIVQKRLKKEKKAKRKLQEALEFETKRREQAEQTLKQAASADSLRVLNGENMHFFLNTQLCFALEEGQC